MSMRQPPAPKTRRLDTATGGLANERGNDDSRQVTIEIIGDGDVDTHVFEGPDAMARAADFLGRRTAGRLEANRHSHLPGSAIIPEPAPRADRQRH